MRSTFSPGAVVSYAANDSVFLGVVLGDHMLRGYTGSVVFDADRHRVCVELGFFVSGGFHMHRPGSGYRCEVVPVVDMVKVLGVGVLEHFLKHLKNGSGTVEGKHFATLFGLTTPAQLQMISACVLAYEFTRLKGSVPDDLLARSLDAESREELLGILREGILFPQK